MFVWLIAIVCLSILSPSNAAKKPNILFVVIDDLRPILSCYGDDLSITPNFDHLAESGVIFRNTYSQQALCAPSRTSFLTSRRPDSLQFYDAHSYWRNHAGNFTTIPQHFKENGYHTVSVGKVFHPGITSNNSDDYPISWSEEPYHASTEKYKFAKVCPSLLNPERPLGVNLVCPVDVNIQPGGSLPDIEATNYVKSVITRLANSSKPFFIGLGYHKPHIPLKYPKEYRDLYPLSKIRLAKYPHRPSALPSISWNPFDDIRLREDVKHLNISYPYGYVPNFYQRLIIQSYYAATSYVDALLGEVINVLKLSKMLHNTIIVLLGDHGWSLGEHGEWSKYSNFDVALKVPLIINIPSSLRVRPQAALVRQQFTYVKPFESYVRKDGNLSVVTDFVELVDLFPTLAELSGIPVPRTCEPYRVERLCTEGRSLVPLIDRAMPLKLHRSGSFLSRFEKRLAFSQYPRPTIKPGHSSDQPKLSEIRYMGYTMKSSSVRYTEWLKFNSTSIEPEWSHVVARELYLNDSYEINNCADDPKYKPIVHQLGKILRKGWRSF